ncbi:MAG: amino acid ABC transporter substrate-binding protein [Acidimicrobiales bacterium]|nr:amino acid ABC transporter substrate-binding protein [Acidimicrobiales bacterium]
MKKTLLGMLLAFALLGAACGSDAVENVTADDSSSTDDGEMAADSGEMTETDHCSAIKTKGTLTVATGDPVFPPWMIDDDPTNGEGFESAVVYAVADELGLDVTWVRTTFDQSYAPGAKDYDFNVQQISITEEREAAVDFSTPYYVAEQAIIATDENAFANVTSVEDLKGLKLGAGLGTTSLTYIEDVIQPDTDAAVFDDNVAAKAAFDAGQIDGLVLDLPTAYYVSAVEIDGAFIAGVLPEIQEGADSLGFAFEEGSEFTPCINAALETLRTDGVLEALEEQYLNNAGEIPTFSN